MLRALWLGAASALPTARELVASGARRTHAAGTVIIGRLQNKRGFRGVVGPVVATYR